MERGRNFLKFTYSPFSMRLMQLVGIGAGVYKLWEIMGEGVGDLELGDLVLRLRESRGDEEGDELLPAVLVEERRSELEVRFPFLLSDLSLFLEFLSGAGDLLDDLCDCLLEDLLRGDADLLGDFLGLLGGDTDLDLLGDFLDLL